MGEFGDFKSVYRFLNITFKISFSSGTCVSLGRSAACISLSELLTDFWENGDLLFLYKI